MGFQNLLKIFILIESLLISNKLCQAFTYTKDCECGLSSDYSPRIIGGRSSSPDSYPFIAIIILKQESICGGSLITSNYILTAGHCIMEDSLKDYKVALGAQYKDTLLSDPDVVFANVVDAIRHEDYESNEIRDTNDIALLKLDREISFSPKIQTVCLPQKGEDYTGRTVTILGFGRLRESGTTSNTLNVAEVKIIPYKDCEKIDLIGPNLTKQMLCGYGNKTDACQGDSGGPSVLKNKDDIIEQIGVISWGIGCGRPGMPGLYTKVNDYLEWIDKNTAGSKYCQVPTSQRK